ncbi:RES domain-containing protein [Paenarthrobacter sp. NPDC057981]|uniref:RES domain-containing protein n=1 Tax=Paenarthrobacter sp. NPDC057981 TaxID=3346297 RepID=UPI0036D8AEC7
MPSRATLILMSGASELWPDEGDSTFKNVDGAMCRTHITDAHLLERLSVSSEKNTGSLCALCSDGATGDLIPLWEVQRHIMEVFRSLYEPAQNAGLILDDGWQGADVYDQWEILYQVCENAIEDNVFDSLVDVLGKAMLEYDWTENRHHGSLDATYWGWDQFELDVRTRSRFVFPPAVEDDARVQAPGQRSEAFLQGLLPYVENEELGLVSIVPRGTLFYRGRLVSDENSKLVSAAALGPAPAKLAAVNRMSPEGIPMFYGSAAPETAIEEIASHGTRNYARIGGFRSQKDLRVLDLTRNLNMPSLFAPGTLEKIGVLWFFRRFAENVTAPMGPDDNPNLTYVPTQVLTEYFRWVPRTPIEGIRLSSAQNGQPTFVLFLDSDSVADAADVDRADTSSPTPHSAGWFGISLPPPVLTLHPDDVRTYKLKRHVTSTLVEPPGTQGLAEGEQT